MINREIKDSVQITLKKESTKILDSFSKEKGINRSLFVEDMLIVLNSLRNNPDKLIQFVGIHMYEKYFKNS